jgi:hypothetical protein
MSGAAVACMIGAAFSPIIHTYTSGDTQNETVPTGASFVTITLDGGGGSGAQPTGAAFGGGGGGGARCVFRIAVSGGQTLLYTVGASVAGGHGDAGTDGNRSRVSGTVLGGIVNMTANGGFGADNSGNGGAGGTASGGTTNTSGSAGAAASGSICGKGGTAGSGALGGSGTGSGGQAGVAPGGGGAGGTLGTGTPTIGGAGARGQVSFAYV